MTKHNAENERIKRKYLTFLKQAKGQNEATIDSVAKALSRFESYNKYKNFKAFHYQQAIGFKEHLAKHKNQKTGKPLSLSTMNSTARHLTAFIEWLSQQVGYKSRISFSDAQYFNLSEKDTRTAKATRKKPVATIEQINHVLSVMPNTTAIEKRDRALIAFTLLTGARDSAIASMKVKHVDISAGLVHQDAREVETKYSKTFTTYFFPVDDSVYRTATEWVEYLKNELLFGNDEPLFPKTKTGVGANHNFEALGLSKEHWSSAAAIREIFKRAFALAELPYFNPHSFRNTLAVLGEQLCQTPEQFKAWSQNLGHEGVLTTLYSYGEVQDNRQAELFKAFKKPHMALATGSNADEIAQAVIKAMANQKPVA
jgi:integrase/recombinase XerD